jgi:hypothetical protein
MFQTLFLAGFTYFPFFDALSLLQAKIEELKGPSHVASTVKLIASGSVSTNAFKLGEARLLA